MLLFSLLFAAKCSELLVRSLFCIILLCICVKHVRFSLWMRMQYGGCIRTFCTTLSQSTAVYNLSLANLTAVWIKELHLILKSARCCSEWDQQPKVIKSSLHQCSLSTCCLPMLSAVWCMDEGKHTVFVEKLSLKRQKRGNSSQIRWLWSAKTQIQASTYSRPRNYSYPY